MPVSTTLKTYGRKRCNKSTITNTSTVKISEASAVFDKLLAKNLKKRDLSFKNTTKLRKQSKHIGSTAVPQLLSPEPTELFSDDSLKVRINSTFDDLFHGPVYKPVQYTNSSKLQVNSSSDPSNCNEKSIIQTRFSKRKRCIENKDNKSKVGENLMGNVKKRKYTRKKKVEILSDDPKQSKCITKSLRSHKKNANKLEDRIPIVCLPRLNILSEPINNSLIIENEINRDRTVEFTKYLNQYNLHNSLAVKQYPCPKSPPCLNSLIASECSLNLNNENLFSSVYQHRMQAESTPKYIHSTPLVQRKFKIVDSKIDSVSPINRKINHRQILSFTKLPNIVNSFPTCNSFSLFKSFQNELTVNNAKNRDISVVNDKKLNAQALVMLDNCIDLIGISGRISIPDPKYKKFSMNNSDSSYPTNKTSKLKELKPLHKYETRLNTKQNNDSDKIQTILFNFEVEGPENSVHLREMNMNSSVDAINNTEITVPKNVAVDNKIFQVEHEHSPENTEIVAKYAVDLKKWEDFSNSLFLRKKSLSICDYSVLSLNSFSSTESNKSTDSVIEVHNDSPKPENKIIEISDDEEDYIILKPGKSWFRSLSILKNFNDVLPKKNKVGRKWRHSFNSLIHQNLNYTSKTDYGNNARKRITIQVILNPHVQRQSTGTKNKRYVQAATNDTVLEKFAKLSLNKLHRDRTAKEIVLKRCRQIKPIGFDKCFTENTLKKCRKIGEGVYGEVFMRKTTEDKCLVMKIIPIEGRQAVNGEQQKKYEEIISEVIIASELSNLRTNIENYTNGFAEVLKIRCVQGTYPKHLIDLWDLYDEDRGSENDSPEIFTDEQLYIVLELSNGGQDLEAYRFKNAEQSHAIFLQTACSLAVAEAALEFEHRDMHWGNILISQTDEPTTTYCLKGREFEVATKGVKVTIIDFTLSRMTFENCCIYNDLALDPDLFTAKGDYQFEVYRLMKKRNNDEWQNFEPYSNILWLGYTLDKIISQVHYTNATTKTHKTFIRKLSQLKKKVLTYSSAAEFVSSDIFLNVFL